MRLLQVNPFFFPRLGGIERRIHHLAREAAAAGHDVTVLCGYDRRDPGRARGASEEPARCMPGLPRGALVSTCDGYRIVRLPSRALPVKWDPPVWRTRHVGQAIAALAPDLIDFHYRWAPEWTRAVVRSGTPWVLTWHNQFGEGAGLLRPLSLLNDVRYRGLARKARAVLCVSRYIATELEHRGFPPGSLHVVPNGSWEPAPGSAEWEADDGRPAPTSPYVIAVGRLTEEKGHDLVLRAFAASAFPGHLVVCGRGPWEGHLRQLSADLGIASRVTFGGWVPESTKWRLLHGAHAMLHMARFESYGISLAEGVVAGLPVVAADVGGVAEVLGPAGILVPSGDWQAAARALDGLGEARARLEAGAKAQARELGWSHAARLACGVYARAVS